MKPAMTTSQAHHDHDHDHNPSPSHRHWVDLRMSLLLMPVTSSALPTSGTLRSHQPQKPSRWAISRPPCLQIANDQILRLLHATSAGTYFAFKSLFLLTCLSIAGKATVYSNADGKTSTMRRHFKKHHKKTWRVSCISFKLKNWETYIEEGTKSTADPEHLTRRYTHSDWSLEGFLDRLVRFLVADDQV